MSEFTPPTPRERADGHLQAINTGNIHVEALLTRLGQPLSPNDRLSIKTTLRNHCAVMQLLLTNAADFAEQHPQEARDAGLGSAEALRGQVARWVTSERIEQETIDELVRLMDAEDES